MAENKRVSLGFFVTPYKWSYGPLLITGVFGPTLKAWGAERDNGGFQKKPLIKQPYWLQKHGHWVGYRLPVNVGRWFCWECFFSRWWFQIYFIFTPSWGFMIQVEEHIFQLGWFNHQLVLHLCRSTSWILRINSYHWCCAFCFPKPHVTRRGESRGVLAVLAG